MGLGPSCTRGEVRTWEINKRPSNLDTRPIPHSTTGQLPSPLPTSTHLMSVAIAFFPHTPKNPPVSTKHETAPFSTTVHSKTSYEFANLYSIHLEFSSVSPRTERYRSALLIQIFYTLFLYGRNENFRRIKGKFISVDYRNILKRKIIIIIIIYASLWLRNIKKNGSKIDQGMYREKRKKLYLPSAEFYYSSSWLLSWKKLFAS